MWMNLRQEVLEEFAHACAWRLPFLEEEGLGFRFDAEKHQRNSEKLAHPRKCPRCGANISLSRVDATRCGSEKCRKAIRVLKAKAGRVCGNPACGEDISAKHADAKVCSERCRYHYKRHLEKMQKVAEAA